MAQKTTLSISLPAAAADVWRVVSEQGALLGSRFIGWPCGKGVGAERHCRDRNGAPVLERVIGWDEGRSYRVTLVQHSLPVVWAEGGVQLEREDARSTRVTFTVDYMPKYGALGRLLDAAFLRSRLERQLSAVIERLAAELGVEGLEAPAAVPLAAG
jgi:hypothetical protein